MSSENAVREVLVIDDEPIRQGAGRTAPVTLQVEAPPPARSNGWGEIPRGRRR